MFCVGMKGFQGALLIRLLEGVLRASRLLIESNRLSEGIHAWLRHLGSAAGADSAMLGRRLEGTTRRARVMSRWTRDPHSPLPRADFAIPDSTDVKRWVETLEAGEVVWTQRSDLRDPQTIYHWDAAGRKSNVLVPVVHSGRTIAWLSLGFASEFAYDAAIAGVLRTAADGVAAAMLRDDALTELLEEREQRLRMERDLLSREQSRSRELGAANESLRLVAQSLMPGTTLLDFLKTIVREVSVVSGSSTGGIFLYDESDATMRLVVSGSKGGPFFVAEPNDEAPWFQPLPAELTARWTHALGREQLVSMDRVEAERTGSCPLAMPWGHCDHLHFEIDLPLMAGDQLVGVLSQLFVSREEASNVDYPHVRALAHMAALAIYQDRLADSAQRMLIEAERQRAEQAQVAELARANASLRAATQALAESGDETHMFSACMSAIQQLANAHTVWLFRSEKDDGIMRLVGSYRDGRFSPEGEERDPISFRQGFDMYGPVSRRLRASDQLVWRSLREQVDEAAYLPATLVWHRQEQHAANAVQVLCVGDRVVGFIGMVFMEHVAPTESQRQHIQSLTQLVALTLELNRQSATTRRHAEQTAVLAERNRLAREIHDSIAQAFVAIQMQIKQLPMEIRRSELLSDVMTMAVHGLNEARRAVSALRPQELLHQQLPAGLERLVQQLTQGTALRVSMEHPPLWNPLPAHVEDHLFRIVQEATSNVVKHANASQLRIELSQTSDETTVLVADDGRGFDPAKPGRGGYGLESIRQRATLIGGQVAWQSDPAYGTQMLVSWSSEPVR